MAKHLGYEPDNLDTNPALIGGLILGAICAVSIVICIWMFDLLEDKVAEKDEALSPLIVERVLPPHPRLQTNPNEDIALLRERENLFLERYHWVDKEEGIARIPIARAIDILAGQGLPTEAEPEETRISDKRGPTNLKEVGE